MSLNKTFEKFYDQYKDWFSVKKPKDVFKTAMKLGEESGEVFEALAALTGSVSKARKIKRKGMIPREAVIEEIGDVMVVCLNLATLCDIDHTELFEAAAKKAKRRADDVRNRKGSK